MNKNTLPMSILIFSALLLGGCATHDPMATPIVNNTYSIIDGDTIKTVVFKDYKKLKDKDPNGKNHITVGDTIVLYKEPKLHTPPAKDPDLSNLKNNDDPDLKGKPLRYVAIGGSLTAGVRDGGYFNEGILTSYPNLIARQMKLEKFEQPLFDNDSYNGFGRKTRTGFNPTGGPVPKFNEVKNNSGVESVDEKGVKLKKNLKQNDNVGITNGTSFSIAGGGYSYLSDSQLNEFQYLPVKNMWPYYNRMIDYTKYNGVSGYISNSKADIVTYQAGMQDILDHIIKGIRTRVLTPLNGGPASPEELFVGYKGKTKLCMATIPDVFDFPYFHIVDVKKAIEAYNQFATYTLPAADEYICFPSSSIDSLLSPKVHVAFKSDMVKKNKVNGIVSKTNIIEDDFINKSNKNIQNLSKKYSFAVVDLYSIYKKIHRGEYITNDGVRVDATYLKGNFYSSDGIYPSPFGNAVIANEFIKAINAYYKSEIPLINTAEYLNLK